MSKNKILAIIFALFMVIGCAFVYIPANGPGHVHITECSVLHNGVVLKWQESQRTDGYEVSRSFLDEKWENIAIVKEATYADENVDDTQKYKYRVRSYQVNSNGDEKYGDYSAVVSASYGPSANGLNAETIKGWITLSWEASANVDGYKIYRCYNANNDWKLLSTVNENIYYDDTVETGLEYSYMIKTYRKINSVMYITSGNIVEIKYK